MKSFGSDNHSGVHPKIMEAVQRANVGHVPAYGEDSFTAEAAERFREIFGEDTGVYFVFNGTGANILSLGAGTSSYNAVICADTAHINVDECGSPEKFTGCKLLTLPTTDGKLTPDLIRRHLGGFGFQHHVQPKVVSISQVTELGTLYSPDEIRAIADIAHQNRMYLHMDGARFANAVASSGATPYDLSVGAGVDIMSFGGTKNGMMGGEAVLIFNSELDRDFVYKRKQASQLASKMRFISAQFSAYLSDGLWLELAAHSNAMAHRLAEGAAAAGVVITRPVDANGVFAIIPTEAARLLREKYYFYVWDDSTGELRWMTSFDTTTHDVDGFVAAIREVMARAGIKYPNSF